MKVRELIDRLKLMSQDKEVTFISSEFFHDWRIPIDYHGEGGRSEVISTHKTISKIKEKDTRIILSE